MIERYLRFRELKERGIVNSRVTLGNRIKHQGFPEGRKIGPNTRAWTETEVADWLASRPTDRKPWPTPRREKTEAA
jgi:predicted DNA-binding transcriptional regulator AlpA